MFLNLESPISSKKLWILLVGNGILSSRSGCCSLFLDWSVVSRPFWRTKNIYFSSTVFNFYCVCVVRTCSHYILSSFPSNFIWPFFSRNYTFSSIHPYIDGSIVVSLGCVKLVIQMLSQDGIMRRTVFPDFLAG